MSEPESPNNHTAESDAAPNQLSLEFTVEPFVESNPGPHVQAAIAAANANTELAVDVGPFGTHVSGPSAEVLKTTQKILAAAFEQGASRVSLQVTNDS